MTFIECSVKCECLGCIITYPLTLKERGIHDISLELFIYHGVQINISVLKVYAAEYKTSTLHRVTITLLRHFEFICPLNKFNSYWN